MAFGIEKTMKKVLKEMIIPEIEKIRVEAREARALAQEMYMKIDRLNELMADMIRRLDIGIKKS